MSIEPSPLRHSIALDDSFGESEEQSRLPMPILSDTPKSPHTDSRIITANSSVANKTVGVIRLSYYADSQKSGIKLGRRGQILR